MAEETYFKSNQVAPASGSFATPADTQVKIDRLRMRANYGLRNVTGAGDDAPEFAQSNFTVFAVSGSGVLLNASISSGLFDDVKTGTLTVPFPNPGSTVQGTLHLDTFEVEIDFQSGHVMPCAFSGMMSDAVTQTQTAAS